MKGVGGARGAAIPSAAGEMAAPGVRGTRGARCGTGCGTGCGGTAKYSAVRRYDAVRRCATRYGSTTQCGSTTRCGDSAGRRPGRQGAPGCRKSGEPGNVRRGRDGVSGPDGATGSTPGAEVQTRTAQTALACRQRSTCLREMRRMSGFTGAI
ncbi:hypothetical protein BN2537_15801 [Streptomyces venezuelae]|nr:hypothetical protein BN2537_15801 [Streptomyces venezuelae]